MVATWRAGVRVVGVAWLAGLGLSRAPLQAAQATSLGSAPASQRAIFKQYYPNQLAKYTRLNTCQSELFGWFLEKLKSTPEGDGTLLDHSLFFCGASLSMLGDSTGRVCRR